MIFSEYDTNEGSGLSAKNVHMPIYYRKYRFKVRLLKFLASILFEIELNFKSLDRNTKTIIVNLDQNFNFYDLIPGFAKSSFEFENRDKAILAHDNQEVSHYHENRAIVVEGRLL